MKSYLCFVHVRPDTVPHLRTLDCDADEHVSGSLGPVLREWASLDRLEVMDGARLVLSASGGALQSFFPH